MCAESVAECEQESSVLLELLPSAFSGSLTAGLFFVVRRVGLTVHLRPRLAHRLQGNFLSHFVLVLAQLLQAIGVRPDDFGTMPAEAGRGS